MERLAHAMNMGQVFGLDFRVNHFIRVGGIGLGREAKAFHPLTPQLELQPPYVLLRVIALAVSLLEE